MDRLSEHFCTSRDAVWSTGHAFFAVLNDKQVVAWGDGGAGGALPVATKRECERVGVRQVWSNRSAFFAVLNDNQVVAWGDRYGGGALPDATKRECERVGVRQVWSNHVAFFAVLNDNQVVAWGKGTKKGGALPDATKRACERVGVRQVWSTANAFFAVLNDNQVVAWGQECAGGDLPDDTKRECERGVRQEFSTVSAFFAVLNDGECERAVVRQVWSTGYAFFAVLNDNQVVAWGDRFEGGALPDATKRECERVGVRQVWSTEHAFFAVLNDKQVVAWGCGGAGGALPVATKRECERVGVRQVWSTAKAFFAVLNDNQVVAWGDGGAGGALPVATKRECERVGVRQVWSTANSFFAVLNDNQVVAWGDNGGALPDATKRECERVGVRQVWSTANAFFAVLNDKQVVAWGHGNGGGALPDNFHGECVNHGVAVLYPTFEASTFRYLHDACVYPSFDHEVMASAQLFLAQLPHTDFAVSADAAKQMLKTLHTESKDILEREIKQKSHASAASVLKSAASPSDQSVVVASLAGFFIGQQIVIDVDTPREEAATINSTDVASLTIRLQTPLRFRHGVDATVTKRWTDAMELEVIAEVLWTSAATMPMQGAKREFCWLVNWCFRSGDRKLLSALLPYIEALNRYSAPVRDGRTNVKVPWNMLTDHKLYRGGGFNMDFKDFFFTGRSFRVPGFWATSPDIGVTDFFIRRAFQAGFPPVRWIIQIDKHALCWHVNYISRSLIQDVTTGKPQENEFLFTQYSAFEVVALDWKPTPTPAAPHEIHLRAYPDNKQAPPNLPLAPWN